MSEEEKYTAFKVIADIAILLSLAYGALVFIMMAFFSPGSIDTIPVVNNPILVGWIIFGIIIYTILTMDLKPLGAILLILALIIALAYSLIWSQVGFIQNLFTDLPIFNQPHNLLALISLFLFFGRLLSGPKTNPVFLILFVLAVLASTGLAVYLLLTA
jgi:hypothetical protein